MSALAEVFELTGGPDPNSPVVPEVEASSAFLKNFSTAQFTGSNGSGPILNANAVLMPTRADNYRENENANDFRLGNGLGISRPYLRQDSQKGQADGGFHGLAYPNKSFGRSTVSHDLIFNRDDLRERADMSLKKMGFKQNEVPLNANFKPWDWNNLQALGIGTHGNQYNRNTPMPDADAVYRRQYEPAPSRRTQMLTTDVEDAALRPNSTRMHPLTVIANDRQREKEQRIPRNADVHETVIYENIHPRGMGAPNGQQAIKVWGDASVLRAPVGTNETGDRSIFGQWKNPTHHTDPLAVSTIEDQLILHKADRQYVRGHDIMRETKEFKGAVDMLRSQFVTDPNQINPRKHEYPRNMTDINGPLVPIPRSGKVI